MSVYLAVDVGGTKTECVVADQDQVLAHTLGGTVELRSEADPRDASKRMRELLHEASSKAGIPLYLVTRACVGLPRLGCDGMRSWAEATLKELLTGELVLTGSEDIAMEAAFGQRPGVLVIAGTGSHVVGRCSNGSRFTAGGWGPVLSDEGSGQWIGLEGLRSGLRALDRGVPSLLMREMQAAWGAQGINALVSKVNGQHRPEFASLAGVVARCAAQGDVLARGVLERAGEHLAAQVSVVLARMKAAACAVGETRRIAFAGGILGRMEPVYRAMVTTLGEKHPGSVVDEEATQPVFGALARARRP